MPDDVWYHLRSSRSQPPGLAGSDDDRRAVYVAAMEQFEELMGASGRVSAATRPLTVFYALAQAGKAIVAAHSKQPPPRRHGITLADPSQDLMQTLVKAERQPGWYHAVSAALSTPTFQQAQLGEIWG